MERRCFSEKVKDSRRNTYFRYLQSEFVDSLLHNGLEEAEAAHVKLEKNEDVDVNLSKRQKQRNSANQIVAELPVSASAQTVDSMSEAAEPTPIPISVSAPMPTVDSIAEVVESAQLVAEESSTTVQLSYSAQLSVELPVSAPKDDPSIAVANEDSDAEIVDTGNFVEGHNENNKRLFSEVAHSSLGSGDDDDDRSYQKHWESITPPTGYEGHDVIDLVCDEES